MKRSEVEFEMMLEKRKNDSKLENMTNMELMALKAKIDKEIQERKQKEIEKVTDEFLAVWKKMEKLGFKVECDSWDCEKMVDLELEINDDIVRIY